MEVAFEKAKVYCDYQDRCHSEVRSKLLQWKVYGSNLEEVMARLIDEGRLNEERFARSYARGKFRNNDWGRQKIIQGLKLKKIGSFLINKALKEINEDEYQMTISKLINKKLIELKGDLTNQEVKKKIVVYLLGKGYSYSEIENGLMGQSLI